MAATVPAGTWGPADRRTRSHRPRPAVQCRLAWRGGRVRSVLEKEENAIPSKVFVGNLSFSTSKEELNTLMSTAGSVVDVYMPTDRATGKPRGFAFVEFASEAEANEAIRQLNGREIGGRALRLNLAEDRPRERPGGGGGGGMRAFGAMPPGPSFFSVEGRPSRPKGSRRGARARKRSL